MSETNIWIDLFDFTSNVNPPFDELMALVKSGQDPMPYLFDQTGKGRPNLLEQSVGFGDQGAVFSRYLLKRGALEMMDEYQIYLVMMEAFSTNQKHILMRVGKHPSLTKDDFSQVLAICIGMSWDSKKKARSIVKLMIDFGADPNYKLENSKETILHRICNASMTYFEGAAEVLIESGADVLALNDDGEVALSLCDPVSSFFPILKKAMAKAEYQKLETGTPPATGSNRATRL